MAPHLWPRDPAEVSRAFAARHGAEPHGTFIWATCAAAGSDYLEKLDARDPAGSDLIDISHVRWATMNALTAIDLCAAMMGRQFCGHTGNNELDLRDFDPKVNRGRRDRTRCGALSGVLKWICREPAKNSTPTANELRASLRPSFLKWVKDTLADQRYKDVRNVRNPLTHSRMNRHLSIGTDPPTQADRTKFPVTGRPQPMNARDLVVMSAELALDRVREFVEIVDKY